MPLYVLRCISTVETEYRLIKELVQNSATTLLKQGAVVRSIHNDGIKRLPQRMRSSPGQYHSLGVYWSMHYDASPTLHTQLTRQIRKDIRVLRWSAFKLAERLDQIVETGSMISIEATKLSDVKKAAEWERDAKAPASGHHNVFNSLQ